VETRVFWKNRPIIQVNQVQRTTEVVFLLEENSAKAMLEQVLENLSLHNISTRYIVFEGKQDLDKQVGKRLKGYSNPNAKFIILRDQDSSDCRELKQQLLQKAQEAGKADQTIVRIACHELESFYLGDLKAVEKALECKLPSQQNKNYRNPDDKLENANEELQKITKNKYQKIKGSRLIGKHLNLNSDRNKSKSFDHLLKTLKSLRIDIT
jgi:hypothetical protein